MENIDKKIDIVNQAVEINNDRIKGYEKAVEIAGESNLRELQALFRQYIDQSRQFIIELSPYLEQFGEEPTEDTKFSGKIFRIWMDIKSAMSPSINQAILECCEKGEDEFKETYKKLLSESLDDYQDLIDLLQNQLAIAMEAHQHIKELRDL
ncbi:PA2169 family four-helix-bundle protein [Sphingobacterium cellulitidis]|uniref:PA2169 family four-helix-bundle protein n=1 Tax=Sphingobacterium cellulitidis TaxID=1768011 RepID=UPI000B94508D|nr:hypothetical protein CHT99_09915 [Sphingobacterium cellulitidis]